MNIFILCIWFSLLLPCSTIEDIIHTSKAWYSSVTASPPTILTSSSSTTTNSVACLSITKQYNPQSKVEMEPYYSPIFFCNSSLDFNTLFNCYFHYFGFMAGGIAHRFQACQQFVLKRSTSSINLEIPLKFLKLHTGCDLNPHPLNCQPTSQRFDPINLNIRKDVFNNTLYIIYEIFVLQQNSLQRINVTWSSNTDFCIQFLDNFRGQITIQQKNNTKNILIECKDCGGDWIKMKQDYEKLTVNYSSSEMDFVTAFRSEFFKETSTSASFSTLTTTAQKKPQQTSSSTGATLRAIQSTEKETISSTSTPTIIDKTTFIALQQPFDPLTLHCNISTPFPNGLEMQRCIETCVAADNYDISELNPRRAEQEFTQAHCKYECMWYKMCFPKASCKDRTTSLCEMFQPEDCNKPSCNRFCANKYYSYDYIRSRCGTTCAMC